LPRKDRRISVINKKEISYYDVWPEEGGYTLEHKITIPIAGVTYQKIY
jgi:hypothetical protein